MLVLNRRPGEAILIDGRLRIVVLECSRRGIRVGIEAPSDVGIMREEILMQIAEENRRATGRSAQEWVEGQLPSQPG